MNHIDSEKDMKLYPTGEMIDLKMTPNANLNYSFSIIIGIERRGMRLVFIQEDNFFRHVKKFVDALSSQSKLEC